MPCSDPIMNERDQRCSRACKILLALEQRGWLGPLPKWVRDAWLWPGGSHLDEATKMLCDFCKSRGEDFIYNGRDADCRALADWWDQHKLSPGHT